MITYFIVGWLFFSVMAYRAYAKHNWGEYGAVLGWRWSDTTFGVVMSLFGGPITLLTLFFFNEIWRHRKADVPIKPRLPRDPTFHKYYTGGL